MDQANNNTQKKPVKITINEKWCKKCGICVAFCPQGVFTADEFGMPKVTYPEKCIKCMLCVIRCPDFAIEVNEDIPIAKRSNGGSLKNDKVCSGK